MYDHKFRQSDLSFGRPQRSRKRPWVWVFVLALAFAALYGLNAWRSADTPDQEDSVAGPNVIPLELPPKAVTD